MNDPVNYIDPIGLSQQQLDEATKWLRTNLPFLFNGINPSIVDSSLPHRIGAGAITPSSALILVDTDAVDNLTSDPLVQQSVIVGLLAHELMHAQIGGPIDNFMANVEVKSHDMIKKFEDKVSKYFFGANNRGRSCSLPKRSN